MRLSQTRTRFEEFIRLLNAGEIDEIHRRWHKAIVLYRRWPAPDGWYSLGLERKTPNFGATNVPVMLYFGLDFTTEAELFDIINSTQRKIPKVLIETTKGDITQSDSTSHAHVNQDDNVFVGA